MDWKLILQVQCDKFPRRLYFCVGFSPAASVDLLSLFPVFPESSNSVFCTSGFFPSRFYRKKSNPFSIRFIFIWSMNSSTVGERLLALNGWALDDPPSITPFQFEQIDIFYWNGFVVRYAPKIGIFTAALYLLLIFSVQRWMKRKPAFQLKYSLFLWNTFMACFSILAVTRVTPPLFRLLFFSQEENGLYLSICAK